MEDKLETCKNILKKYNQEHLLMFFDELDLNEKNMLIEQLLNIDFREIEKLYKNSKELETEDLEAISPLPYVDKRNLSRNEIKHYEEIGINVIKNKELAICTMAGGQGSRLGFKGPKGAFELDTRPKKSLFEIRV